MVVASDTPQMHFAHVGGLRRQSPRDPWVWLYDHGSSDVLFAFAELCTYPTSCCLQNGRVGLVASLLLAVLAHRLGMRCFPSVGQRAADRLAELRGGNIGSVALGDTLGPNLVGFLGR